MKCHLKLHIDTERASKASRGRNGIEELGRITPAARARAPDLVPGVDEQQVAERLGRARRA